MWQPEEKKNAEQEAVEEISLELVINSLKKLNIDEETKENISLLIESYFELQTTLEETNTFKELLHVEYLQIKDNWEKYKSKIETNEVAINELEKENQSMRELLSKKLSQLKGALNTFFSLTDPKQQDKEKQIAKLNNELSTVRGELGLLRKVIENLEKENKKLEQQVLKTKEISGKSVNELTLIREMREKLEKLEVERAKLREQNQGLLQDIEKQRLATSSAEAELRAFKRQSGLISPVQLMASYPGSRVTKNSTPRSELVRSNESKDNEAEKEEVKGLKQWQ